MSIASILKGQDIFQYLTVDEMERVSRIASVKKYEAGQAIYSHESRASHVFILLEGAVVLRLPAGTADVSLVADRVEKGELFGVAPLLGAERYTAAAQCTAPTSILAIEAKELREILLRSPVAGIHAMTLVANVYYHRYLAILRNLHEAVSKFPLTA